jgi:hypothetical protein
MQPTPADIIASPQFGDKYHILNSEYECIMHSEL